MKRIILFMSSLSLFLIFAITSAKAQTQLIIGGNLENSTLWQTSFLNTQAGSEPVVSWNNTTQTPTSGSNGSLLISATAPAGQSQYAIYQKVSLSADKAYRFDGAFKYNGLNNAWCEAFIGTEPVVAEDYGNGQFKLVEFSFWNAPSKTDGTFALDGKNYKLFIPPATGDYYFVIKAGCLAGGEIVIALDELSLIGERVKPIVDFSADVVSGFAPLQVQFTDKSNFATSWSWDFGDSSPLSTDKNPTHVYDNAGNYSVKLTATNEIGETILTKTDYIKVNPAAQLTGGGVLVGGDMTDMSKWMTSFLSTPAGKEPVVSWNNTQKTPSAGRDGALFVSGLSNNSTVQYAIYQKVKLSKDSVYEFNAAFKDFTVNLNQSWLEVFIGTEAPIDGLDFSKDDPNNFLLAEFSTWSTSCNPKGVDGTFLLNGCGNNKFTPVSTGDYYFVLKLGSTSWAGDNMPFELAVDELSLTKNRVKPIAKFSADRPLGFAPLTVQFTDNSNFGTSWEWNFGDSSPLSNLQNPSHVFENVGSYTVTLKVSNEIGETVLTKTDFIKANQKPDLPAGEMLYGGNMEDPNLWNITQLNATSTTTATWNNKSNTLAQGQGGNLLLTASVLNNQSQYCIWQAVELTAGKKYTFNAAFKDLSANLDHFWSEVFIGKTAPEDGKDYGDGQTKIAFFNTWDCAGAPGVDGTYMANGCGRDPKGVFIPETTGTYYFAIKTGMIDWENRVFTYTVMIDEVSLKESENIPAAKADFFADITSGNAPLTVYFTDLSENATSWEWDFGDGNSSNVQNPVHTYTSGGVFTVSLTASNEGSSDKLTVENLITVNTIIGIDEFEKDAPLFYPNPSKGLINVEFKNISNEKILVFESTGKQIEPQISRISHNKMTLSFVKEGIYFIKYISEDKTIIQKVIIQK